MDPAANPFAVMSLIVAPAILTNACSVLAMSTGNRLARAVDRARELSKQLETSRDHATPETVRRLEELAASEERALLLLKALRSLYTGLGGFALAALVSLLGAILVQFQYTVTVQVLEFGAVAAGLVAVAALIHGTSLLVAETRIAVQVLQDRANRLRAQLSHESEA
jgi:predicted nicotinamide N-methyase